MKRHIACAVEQGATVACGGKRPKGLDTGFYLEPTILIDMALDRDAWVEEIFGAVVCIRPFDTEAEAIAQGNDSRFGLAAAVMSADDTRCGGVARAFRAGIVSFTKAPWGGYEQSGIGRKLGRWSLDNYQETRQITRLVGVDPWGWYLK